MEELNEEEKCRNSVQYFYQNYILIDGKKPQLLDLDIFYFEQYSKALSEGKQLIFISKRRKPNN